MMLMRRRSAIKTFDLETYETLVAYNGDILFEWDLVTDHFYATANLFDIFGYMPPSEDFSKTIENSRNIHPDDKAIIKEYFETIQYNFHDLTNRKYYSCLELRIRNAYHKFIWCKVRLAAHYSSQNLPYKISGMITDIDFDKKHQELLIRQAQSDALTGLYNRSSAASFIEETLKKTTKGYSHALILIRFEGLREINAHFGYLFGDAVISDLSSGIRRYFLQSDIVARFGDNDFAVLMTNLSSGFALNENLESLILSLRRSYQSGDDEYAVSVSIGAALYPAHGESLDALLSSARQALSYARSGSKNEYALYRDKMPEAALVEEPEAPPEAPVETPIEKKSFDENLPEYILKILYNTADSDAAIRMLLQVIGKKFDVSRAYVYERSDDGGVYVKSFDWSCPGEASRHKAADEIPAEFADRCYGAQPHKHLLLLNDLSPLGAEEAAQFQKRGVKSCLQARIMESGVPRGWVGFDECRAEREWTPYEIDIAAFLADVLMAFFLKHRAAKKLERAKTGIVRMLHAIDACLYVVDRYSYDVLFMNGKLNAQIGRAESSEGKCHQLIFHSDTPCKDCPMAKLSLEDRRAADEYYDEPSKRWFKRNAAKIDWNDNPDCCLMQLEDISLKKEIEFMPMN